MKEENELIKLDDVSNMIYEIRGEKVMFDFDLARLYRYDVKRLNEQVKRNIEKFPSDFMFEITYEEINFMRSHFATSPKPMMFSSNLGELGIFLMFFRTRYL